MKHDWTKLDNGWTRNDSRHGIEKQLSGGDEFYVDDDGEIFATKDLTPEEVLALLTEAVAQRAKCEIHEPATPELERAMEFLRLWLDGWAIYRVSSGGLYVYLPPDQDHSFDIHKSEVRYWFSGVTIGSELDRKLAHARAVALSAQEILRGRAVE